MAMRLHVATGVLLGVAGLALLSAAEDGNGRRGGELRVAGDAAAKIAACPLERTEVEADVVGFVARVRVTQTFRNPLGEKIEAVYVFPLPEDAAVDEMTMTVGERTIRAVMKPREEARAIYEKAKSAGKVASLLDQERPNVFTQAVANIAPGAKVVIEIAYVETLRFEDGDYEFVFPMVVGPRYMPGSATSSVAPPAPELKGKVHEASSAARPQGLPAPRGTGWSPDTDRVPDASRISPPVAKPGLRAGHDIGLTVRIDAGMPVIGVESVLHKVDTSTDELGRTVVKLSSRDEIPNRDFILRYCVSTDKIGEAFLVHTDKRGAFFTLLLQPPRRVSPRRAVPKEMIFVIDRSGSMSGLPIEKAKQTMRLCIEKMNPGDTFNLHSFSGGTGRCFEGPMPNTPENRKTALDYLAGIHGSGGTRMMPAILEALGGPKDPERVRVVCFMTDGYIGNDFEIIDAVKRHAGTARVFSFGIGTSVNRFLLDGMAHAGRGEVEYVTPGSRRQSGGSGAPGAEASAAARRFAERIASPVLTDVEIDWGGLPVSDVYPRRVPDLFSAKPVMVHGRLSEVKPGVVTLRGRTVGGAFERKIAVSPQESPHRGSALPSLWARAKVGFLMRQDMRGLQRNSFTEELRDEITAIGVEYRLMTQFTSFVAVEEKTAVEDGVPKTIAVPVEMPDGVSHGGVFGTDNAIFGIALGGTGVVGSLGVGGGGSGCFGFRGGGGRRRAALAGGGSRKSETAVDRGLRWLAHNQEPDGSWAIKRHGGSSGEEWRPAVTGFAVLSFLGAGHTGKTGKYKATVWKALTYLMRHQKASGEIGDNRSEATGGGLNHAVAGLALAEAYGMSRIPSAGTAAQKAVDFTINRFQKEYSGWGSSPGAEPRTLVTVWFVLQLKSAKVARLSVDGKGFQGAASYFGKVTVPAGKDDAARVSPAVGGPVTRRATAAALAARQLMGWKRTDPIIIGAANFIGEDLPAWDAAGTSVDLQYWCLGTMGMFQMGGDWWKRWNSALRDMLIEHQRSGAPALDGSWDPAGSLGKMLGRAYSTAMCGLCLEVYYRYLPLYK